MVKYYCDACGKEETDRLYELPIYCHITNENRLMGHVKVVDGKMQPISGRTEIQQLCLVCYNTVVPPLWERILEIKRSANGR